jgi:hypothetical protein
MVTQPALMSVRLVYVLAAVRTSSPSPTLEKIPVPEMTPLTVSWLKSL